MFTSSADLFILFLLVVLYMTVGEKIKIARTLRGFTQKELASLIGLADVRIRQYETNIRTPKDAQLQSIASALGVPFCFFSTHSLETKDDIMQALFELNAETGIQVLPIKSNTNADTQYAITFNDTSLNNLLAKWYEQQQKENTQYLDTPYTEWEITYPDSSVKQMASKLKAKRKELSGE